MNQTFQVLALEFHSILFVACGDREAKKEIGTNIVSFDDISHCDKRRGMSSDKNYVSKF